MGPLVRGPGRNKWFTRLVVAGAIIDPLWSLDLQFPEIGDARRAEMVAARRGLLSE